MEKIQLYFRMFTILKQNKDHFQRIDLDEFLLRADPFSMSEDKSITTAFIDYYDAHSKENKNTYDLILSFLSSFSNPILTDAFQSCTKEEWQQQEETSLYQFS